MKYLNKTARNNTMLNRWWNNKLNKQPINNPMTDLFNDLKQVALIWLANIVGIVASIMPLFQFIGICLGILVSISTLVIHIDKIKNLFKNKTS